MSPTAPGRRGPRARRVTLADVAARAHVDPSVVSKVVSGDPSLRIRPETRRRVLAAIRDTGYRPNALARSLRSARSGMLGMFVPDFTDAASARIVAGAETAAAELGMLLVTGSNTGPGLRRYVELLGRGRIDGLLLVRDEQGSGVLGELERSGVPWLLLDLAGGQARRHVVPDDERAAALAVTHLRSLGHRRIAQLPARRAGGTHGHGATAMRAFLRRGSQATAVIVPDVVAATGALAALRAVGRSVPGDLSVVALRDLPPAADLTPPLTAVRTPFGDLGRRGVELLVRTGADRPVAEVVSTGVRLVERGSTGPPR
ncbi:MAG: LacI family DNA-binding transcriptional regulator [Streptosporangiales bacterium]|nr:LacI family DNA-binding transcriptional regulator [Streptosporangiales bacterium]MBO0889446.1 LacI family DNA-binding transcriptional regulator [Acidothermales bacterium]